MLFALKYISHTWKIILFKNRNISQSCLSDNKYTNNQHYRCLFYVQKFVIFSSDASRLNGFSSSDKIGSCFFLGNQIESTAYSLPKTLVYDFYFSKQMTYVIWKASILFHASHVCWRVKIMTLLSSYQHSTLITLSSDKFLKKLFYPFHFSRRMPGGFPRQKLTTCLLFCENF